MTQTGEGAAVMAIERQQLLNMAVMNFNHISNLKKIISQTNLKKLIILIASNLHQHKLHDLRAPPQSEATVSRFK